MRTIIGLLIFAALLWVALHWSLFSILFMALMLVIAIAVVRMSHHVSPIDFYRIGFAIRTGALFVVGFIFGIIRFVLGMLILAGVIWAAGWGIGKIGDYWLLNCWKLLRSRVTSMLLTIWRRCMREETAR